MDLAIVAYINKTDIFRMVLNIKEFSATEWALVVYYVPDYSTYLSLKHDLG